MSEAKPVHSGIPQGSVLGPLLFISYINDLPNSCQNLCDLYLFTDDAKLYKCIDEQLNSDALNLCFKNVLEWSNNWLMKLNIAKCKVLSLYCNRKHLSRSLIAIVYLNQRHYSEQKI